MSLQFHVRRTLPAEVAFRGGILIERQSKWKKWQCQCLYPCFFFVLLNFLPTKANMSIESFVQCTSLKRSERNPGPLIDDLLGQYLGLYFCWFDSSSNLHCIEMSIRVAFVRIWTSHYQLVEYDVTYLQDDSLAWLLNVCIVNLQKLLVSFAMLRRYWDNTV